MDKILENFLKDFSTNLGFQNERIDKQFEHYVNYCVISKIDNHADTLEKVNVGGDSNPGIDGLAIVVNDHVVSAQEDVDYFYDILDRLDVEFIFTQSKTSPKFEMAQINNFLFSVKNFFSDVTLKFEDDVLNLKELKDYIYNQSINMERSPDLKLYFASTGNWTNDQNVMSIVNSNIKELEATGIFRNVIFQPLDKEKLKSLYREAKHKITKEINFEKHTILPRINNVTESYIGYVPVTEIVNLVSNSEGEIIKSLFYDNVRDFQGFNRVNSDIKSSITNSLYNDKFVLLNNGITIVAKLANKVGTYFKISDFQIVNGCQTTHVLYHLKDELNANTNIPLKLIITDNVEVSNSVIKATNQQTEVKREAFEILSPFHKTLEEFYLSFEKEENKRLYYERRSKQFDDLKIHRNSIISLATQISCYVAMFLNEPHSTKRYYGELLRAYKSRMFQINHSPFPYYTAGLGLHVLDNFFKAGVLNAKYRNFRPHFLMMFRIKTAGEKMPPVKSNKIEKYCTDILEKLWDREEAKSIFLELQGTLEDSISKSALVSRKLHVLKAFTEELQPSVKRSKLIGDITYFNDFQGYGFVRVLETKTDVFVHISQMMKAFGKKVEVNDRIKFDLVETYKGAQAQNLELVR